MRTAEGPMRFTLLPGLPLAKAVEKGKMEARE